ncbi:GNAT family N-acetyltransferase [Paenibacillus sp. GCM10027629]|uniref:GNAT family N-acetyltransferase n=1 Tax=Paenibacillus sp. GCM10027629 TaxID=3273414 RepID=UPI0036450475
MNAFQDNLPVMHIVPMTTTHAAAVCSWEFEPPYNIYGFLPWEEMQKIGIEFGDPELRDEQYRAIESPDGKLIGFAQFFPMVDVTRLGVCMRPDLCGQGLGSRFMDTIVQEAILRSPQDEIDLEVHSWNKRAIRTYQKVGFVITDTYDRRTPTGIAEFHCMVLQGHSSR